MTWFWQFEKRLIDMLLRSPSFHRGVQRVHKTVHQIQHGKPPEYHSGTHIDSEKEASQGVKHFFKLLWDELKTGHKPGDPPTKR